MSTALADPAVNAARALPRDFREWRDRHRGETIVVCGCGRSLRELPEPARWTTIGVNDVGRLFDPTYLVVLNPPHQFTGDRFRYVVESRAQALFTQLDLRPAGVAHPHVVRFRLGRRSGTDLSAAEGLPYTRNSPYVAVCLAAFMGARRIGLIGVDFTDHHFFGATGTHALTRELAAIDREYDALAAALAREGIELVNLSSASRLTSLRKVAPQSFSEGPASLPDAPAPDQRALSIVSYATTPVAGVPPILARCISARTPHQARCVWATESYGNGVAFTGDLEWSRAPRDAEAALAGADVVIVHNGKVDDRHARILAAKPVVTMAHNYLWNVDTRFVKAGFPGVVVGQYQATLQEFAGWSAVPNPLPVWEEAFTPGAKAPDVTICYTPSGRHERYPEGHRLYWHGKGYETTMRVLDRMAARYGVRLEVIRQGQISHSDVLAMKRRAHIVIDECVTGSYHRNTLEGLAAGCVVVNGLGLLPGVDDVFRRCALDADRVPCVGTRLEDLEATLAQLIERGAAALEADGRANREWMERHWDFTAQWQRFWWPAVVEALARAQPQIQHGEAPPARRVLRKEPIMRAARQRHRVLNPRHTVSVVVPHGGAERLRHLATTLATLRQRDAVNEVIVSEMGDAPMAGDLARRWADKYVFTRSSDAFDRARMLNVGSGVAECDLVLWHDNDLLMPGDFIGRAARELHDRRLDYLIPYTSVRYLSEAASLEVMRGARPPWECQHVSELFSSRRVPACSGGAGLVRRNFLLRFGGFVEGFRGWGGEDNAWNRKVALLGRTAATARLDQHAYHLFHPSSAGYPNHAAHASNPHYAHNVWLLRRVSSIRDAREFLRQFPPPAHRPRPWDEQRRIVLLAGAGRDHERAAAIAQALRGTYGASVDEAPLIAGDGWHDRAASADALVVLGDAAGDDRSRDLESQVGRPLPVLRLPLVPEDPVAAATALVGPLSLLLGAGVAAPEPLSGTGAGDEGLADHVERPTDQPAPGSDPVHQPLPVWTYWEGPCPQWIEQCRATITAHGGDVRHLTPESFDALRDIDRDIDLSTLGPAHRADFIRAFVLARFGGLWIDSDCIVMQPLAGLLDLVREHEFVAHRERSGYVSNGFIGARPGSGIARAFYETLCRILRSRRPLGWISLGGEPLTQLLNSRVGEWHELRCEQVQPICWSTPEAFATRGPESSHDSRLDRSAFCYMMSNTEVTKRFGAGHGVLTEADTFFTYLVNSALGTRHEPSDEEVFTGFVAAYRRYGDESLSGPGSSLEQTAVLRERLPLLLEQMGIRSLLDAPCGDFNWMRRVRLGLDQYLGVDMLAELIEHNQRHHTTATRTFRRADLRIDTLPSMDAILCRDCLVHLSFANAIAVLRNFKRSGAQYLLTTTFPSRGGNADTSRCEWRPLNLELPPFNFPPPLCAINEQCTEAGGAFRDKTMGLWRLADVPV